MAGIGGYGNSFGVPTVGGSVGFDRRYDGNILVNAFAVGVAKADAIFTAKATGVGNPIVYLGSKTGRDGIHGATMASAAFEADADEKRPTVQVGDPFAEKLLLEACLELMASGAVIAIQDMGAAGLTSSAVEMGAKGDLGVELDLNSVPCRETGMSAYEMMLSESQERMLMVLKPEKEAEAEQIFRKWGLDFAVIGKTTDTKRFVVKHGGEVKADLPIKELGDQAPLYDRAWTPTAPSPAIDGAAIVPPMPTDAALLKLIHSPDLCSKRWVYEQYDSLILGNTVQGPGGGAAIVRLGDGPKGLALTTDCTERYCEADPREGGQAGGGGGLAQPDRGRRAAAGADRQSQFRQSGETARHGPARRLHPGHRRGRAGARLSDRLGQRVALQRDDGDRHSAHPRDRRRRSGRRRGQDRGASLQGGGRRRSPGRRAPELARPLGLAANRRRTRRGRAAAGRPRRRAPQRRLRRLADRRGPGQRGAGPFRRRPGRRGRGNGDGRRDRRDDIERPAPSTRSSSARIRAAMC